MQKSWNIIGKMTICSFAAAMIALVGTGFGMTARAEMIINSEEELQTVQETTIVPESADTDVLPEEAPAAEKMPEAGDLQIEGMELVEIEEDLIPGAAQPDFVASGEEAEAPEVLKTSDTPKKAAPETCVSGILTYEDSEVVVTVIASEAAQLPADTKVKVTKLAEGSERYESAKEAANQSLPVGGNASYVFYDVTLESEGRALDVEEGTVSVRMEFRTSGEAKREVVSIKETESGKVARRVTDKTSWKGNAASVELAY